MLNRCSLIYVDEADNKKTQNAYIHTAEYESITYGNLPTVHSMHV